MSETWIEELVEAVNDDNERPGATCDTSTTLSLLIQPPPNLQGQAGLAAADFAAAGTAPLDMLRSDVVAAEFGVISGGTPNVLVARMTVPGGPWPGHYGLEAVAFTATAVTFPHWFPATTAGSNIHFADVLAASNGFDRGQGAVLFPELLSMRRPCRGQAFGVVFVDRLTTLYQEYVRPVVAQLHPATLGTSGVRAARELAFKAHEWGHLSGPVDYESAVLARRQRAIAVISELHADLGALHMLMTAGRDDAAAAAETLLFDRILRDAWLPRAHSQVDSVAARQLLNLLRDTSFVTQTPHGPRFNLDRAWERLGEERDLVKDVEIRCASGDTAPAQRYLAGYGWSVDHRGAYRSNGETAFLTGLLERTTEPQP